MAKKKKRGRKNYISVLLRSLAKRLHCPKQLFVQFIYFREINSLIYVHPQCTTAVVPNLFGYVYYIQICLCKNNSL